MSKHNREQLRDIHDKDYAEKHRPPQKWVDEEGDHKLKQKFK